MRLLAYGCFADNLDESLWIAESTTIECLEYFVKVVIENFGPQYLRMPKVEDIQ